MAASLASIYLSSPFILCWSGHAFVCISPYRFAEGGCRKKMGCMLWIRPQKRTLSIPSMHATTMMGQINYPKAVARLSGARLQTKLKLETIAFGIGGSLTDMETWRRLFFLSPPAGAQCNSHEQPLSP